MGLSTSPVGSPRWIKRPASGGRVVLLPDDEREFNHHHRKKLCRLVDKSRNVCTNACSNRAFSGFPEGKGVAFLVAAPGEGQEREGLPLTHHEHAAHPQHPSRAGTTSSTLSPHAACRLFKWRNPCAGRQLRPEDSRGL